MISFMSEHPIELEQSQTVVDPFHCSSCDSDEDGSSLLSSSVESLRMKPKLPTPDLEKVSQEKVARRQLSWKVAENLFVSFKHAWAGVSYAFETQRNFRIHTSIGSLTIALSLLLHLESVKVAIVGLTIGLVLAFELLNTALESVVDLAIERNYHPLAKIAKDCAAGAVLISALAAIVVAGVLILPALFSAVASALQF
jgi:diacylglycerol kinase (ATP)